LVRVGDFGGATIFYTHHNCLGDTRAPGDKRGRKTVVFWGGWGGPRPRTEGSFQKQGLFRGEPPRKVVERQTVGLGGAPPTKGSGGGGPNFPF